VLHGHFDPALTLGLGSAPYGCQWSTIGLDLNPEGVLNDGCKDRDSLKPILSTKEIASKRLSCPESGIDSKHLEEKVED